MATATRSTLPRTIYWFALIRQRQDNFGFRAIAPDLRGFGESDKPADVEAYAPPVILEDVVGLLDKLGTELLFQFRGVAEQLLTRNDWQLCRDLVRHHSETGKWIADLSRPGALSAALNWDRANAGPEDFLADRMPLRNVQAPTLGVWSSGDAYLTEAQMVRSSDSVSGSRHYERLEGASHWMQLDRPREMNRLLVDFLAGRSR